MCGIIRDAKSAKFAKGTLGRVRGELVQTGYMGD